MAAFHCCGNQPTPIIVGLLVTYLTGLIDCYPLLSSSSSQSLPLPSENMNLGKVVYRPNFNSHSLVSSSVASSPLSSPSSQSQSSSSSSSPSPSKSIISPSSPSSSSSPSPVASQPSQQSPSHSASSYHHLSSSSIPEFAFIRGPISDDDGAITNHRPTTYQDYFDTFRLPLIPSTDNNIDLISNRLSNGKQLKSPKYIFSQQSTSPIDFDYVPYIQSDFNQPPPSSSYGLERSSDLYEDDYSDPIYDSKYDPIADSNWLNEPTLSSYHQLQPQPQQQHALPSISFISQQSPYSSYSPYSLPLSPSSSSSGNSGSSSEELLTNLMVDYFVKELERNAQQQSSSRSPEPVQHLIRLKQKQNHPQQQQQQPIDELKAYEGYMEKKSSSPSSSSFNRDKGPSSSSGDKNIKKKETDSIKRIEQKGQKEFPMLRPATENNGKDDFDNQPSLTSQLKSLSNNQQIEKTDDEVNQLKSLLQSV